jgi:hypothetical protein
MPKEINNENKEPRKKEGSPVGWEDLTKEEEDALPANQKDDIVSETKEKGKNQKERKKNERLSNEIDKEILTKQITHPIWLGISECAKIGGVQPKTIRRALKSGHLKYKVEGNRYFIDLKTLILYLKSTKKLQNKLKKKGIGQYIEKWKK